MENQQKELFGAWIQAIGTVIAAIGSTPTTVLSSDYRENLDLWGNALQGTGNALIADAQETFSLNKLGNEVQAIGNSTVIAGMVIDFKEETKQKVIINGNWLQALGGGIALPEDLEAEVSTIRTLSISGNVLQIVGNTLQAIGGINELKSDTDNLESYKEFNKRNKENKDSDENVLEINGSWIQAVGSVISAIATTKEQMLNK
jgi:hypothetical protein